LLLLFLVLAVRAHDPYRWSDWGFGDAQSMLSLRQWNEGGWYANFFLFIPQGYAHVVRLFDEPELRHHAHGICPTSAPGVGPRLWYTHYPSGYLVPYALLFKLGLKGIFTARLLSLVLSFAALLLMYVVFSRIAGPAVSFIATVFYGLSPVFLGYADSIANQPLDDLLRFGFILAIFLSTRAESDSRRRKWAIAAWGIEFALSLSSLDSVFFVFIWLVGWDMIESKGFRWRRYLLFGLAPVTAHSLQFMQNAWYLGWETAILDVKVTFLQKAGTGGGGRVADVIDALKSVISGVYRPSWLAGVLAAVYMPYRAFVSDRWDALPSAALLMLLFLCGAAYPAVFPGSASMAYQGRQMAPFLSLMVGGAAWSIVSFVLIQLRPEPQDSTRRRSGGTKRVLATIYCVVTAVLLLGGMYEFVLQPRYPGYYIPREKSDQLSAKDTNSLRRAMGLALRDDVQFAELVRNLPAAYDQVFFDMGGFRSLWNAGYVPGYPQINPIVEYYAGSKPILCFKEASGAAHDIGYLLNHCDRPFSPVLISRDVKKIESVVSLLETRGLLLKKPLSVQTAMGRCALDLTPYLEWKHR
jgi:hypothetical protein